MDEQITVRTASHDDAEGWLDLFAEVAAEGKWIGAEAPIDSLEWREIFEKRLDSPDALVIVAEVDRHIVGVVNALPRRGVVNLSLIVQENWRGRGIGSQLLDRCLRWATGQRAHKVFLEVWTHNKDAIALYHKFGFTEEGRLNRHYRRRNGELWDSIQMGLVLDHTSPGSPF